MVKHGLPINDLHATTQAFPPAMFAGLGNVHFSAEGSAKLAEQVVAHVAEALPIPANAAPAKTTLATLMPIYFIHFFIIAPFKIYIVFFTFKYNF
jgi:hypothetical protein